MIPVNKIFRLHNNSRKNISENELIIPYKITEIKLTSPKPKIKFNGKELNDKRPSTASEKSFFNVNFDTPPTFFAYIIYRYSPEAKP